MNAAAIGSVKKQMRKKDDMYAVRVSNNTDALALFAVSDESVWNVCVCVTMETKRDTNKLNKLIQIIYDSCVNWKKRSNKRTGQAYICGVHTE